MPKYQSAKVPKCQSTIVPGIIVSGAIVVPVGSITLCPSTEVRSTILPGTIVVPVPGGQMTLSGVRR